MYICIFYRFSILQWHRWLKSILMEDKDPLILHSQCHTISSDDLVLQRARTSSAMALAQSSQNISMQSWEGLKLVSNLIGWWLALHLNFHHAFPLLMSISSGFSLSIPSICHKLYPCNETKTPLKIGIDHSCLLPQWCELSYLFNFSEYQEAYPSSFTANYDGYILGVAAGLMLESAELMVMDAPQYSLILILWMSLKRQKSRQPSDGIWHHFDGLVQERRNSSALAMELCLSCTNP